MSYHFLRKLRDLMAFRKPRIVGTPCARSGVCGMKEYGVNGHCGLLDTADNARPQGNSNVRQHYACRRLFVPFSTNWVADVFGILEIRINNMVWGRRLVFGFWHITSIRMMSISRRMRLRLTVHPSRRNTATMRRAA
jgi:hypothetical protein